MLTIPRELWTTEAGEMKITPVKELELLRESETRIENIWISDVAALNIKGSSLEIVCEFEVENDTPTSFGLHIRKSKKGDEYVEIRYDVQSKQLIMDLRQSGKESKEVSIASLALINEDILRLRLFIDKSSIELFANEGILSMTNRIYPRENSIHVDAFATNGTVKINKLQAWQLKNIWEK